MPPICRRAPVALLLFLLSVVPGPVRAEEDRPLPASPRVSRSTTDRDRIEAQKLFGLASIHERNNRLIEAIRTYESAQKLDPESAAIPRALFGLYIAMDRTDDALNACKKVLQVDPTDATTGYAYARQLRTLERFDDAIAALNQASRSDRLKEMPDLASQIHFDLGMLQERKGNWKAAEAAFRKVVEILETSPVLLTSGKFNREEITGQVAETLERIGKLCLKSNQVNEAVRAFDQARRKDPLRAPRLAFNLAQVYRDQGKLKESLEQLETYLRSQPQGMEGYEMRIELQRKVGRQDDIVADLEKDSGRDPHNLALRLLYARELRKVRRLADAEAIYTKLLEIHVTPEVYRGLFQLYREREAAGIQQLLTLLDGILDRGAGDEKRAPSESDARRARAMLLVLRDEPELVRNLLPAAVARTGRKELSYTTRGVLATLAARTRQLDRAEELYRSCLDRPGGLGTMEAEVFAGLLRVLRLQNKYKEIVHVSKDGLAVAQQTNRVLFHTELVRAYQVLDNHKAALAAADAAVTDAGKPQLLMCRRIRVDALVQAGQADKAFAECQELLKEFTNGSELRDVRYTLSSVLQAQGKHDQAEEQLQMILRLDPNDATANNDLGYLWADRNKNLADAERMIRKAIELDRQQRTTGTAIDADSDRDNAAYIDSLGWVLFRRGLLAEAARELEKASTLPHGEDDPVVWDHLGDVYHRLMLPEKALEAWKKSLGLYDQGARRKSDPRYRDIQNKLHEATHTEK
ncbi:MAG: tetratricopeptide repeat protein [Gemmataceae bacterium]